MARLAHGRVLATVLVVLAGAASGRAQEPLTSQWRTLSIEVDGDPSDWPPYEVLSEGPAVGVLNDDEFLYVVVSSDDPDVVGMIATGLIVWLDPSGRERQTFGVWIPGVIDRPLPGATPDIAPEVILSGFSTETLDRFDLLGPGENQRRLVDITPELDMEIASGIQQGLVVYEMKLPLLKTDARRYAVGASSGRIGLGIATPERPRTNRRQPLVGSSGRVGGASPTYPGLPGLPGIPGVGPYRPGAGGRGFAPYREPPEGADPLELWTTFTLATSQP